MLHHNCSVGIPAHDERSEISIASNCSWARMPTLQEQKNG